jgi:hypothetical protein
MKPIITFQNAAQVVTCGLMAFLLGCKEGELPTAWNPAESGGPAPVISSVSPAGAAWAGITPIVLNGQNFSNDATVYFGNSIAAVKSITPTQITINPPLDTGSTFVIRVVNRDAFQYAVVKPYALMSVKNDYPKLIDSSFIGSFAVDANDNVYAVQTGSVFTIPAGQGPSFIGDASDVGNPSCARLKRDGYLYMTNRAKFRIYRQNLASGVEEIYLLVGGGGFTEVFDFGKDGKSIYTGGFRNFSFVDPNLNVIKSSFYQSDSIRAVRVYNDYVYVAVQRTAIYRHKINADGSPGQQEKYFDWQNAGSAKNASINDITFADNGDLYIATDYTNPILIVHPDGSTAFLYPGALDSPVTNFMWGANSPNLYLNYFKPGAKRIGRVVIDGNLSPLKMKPIKGAPYYGRDL